MQVHMNVTESHLRVVDFVLWAHCQNLLDDPRIYTFSAHLTEPNRVVLELSSVHPFLPCVNAFTLLIQIFLRVAVKSYIKHVLGGGCLP